MVLVLVMVLDMVFTTHPLLVLPLPIKQLNIFPVPSLLWPVNLLPSMLPAMEVMEVMATMAARSDQLRLTPQSLLSPTLHPQLPPLFTLMVMLSVTVMVFPMHPPLVIPLNIKQLNIFPVPSQLLPVNLQ